MTHSAPDSLQSRDVPNTADRILDAAEALFAERGLAGTAVRDIAARTGLNPASLYNHFPRQCSNAG
jgi:AcrR family transcriptional regulator